MFVANISTLLPASDRKLEEIRIETENDNTLKVVMKYIKKGWPKKKDKCELHQGGHFLEKPGKTWKSLEFKKLSGKP